MLAQEAWWLVVGLLVLGSCWWWPQAGRQAGRKWGHGPSGGETGRETDARPNAGVTMGWGPKLVGSSSCRHAARPGREDPSP